MRSLLVCFADVDRSDRTPSDECDTTLTETMSSTHGLKDFSSNLKRWSRWSDLATLRRPTAPFWPPLLWVERCHRGTPERNWRRCPLGWVETRCPGSSSADFQFMSQIPKGKSCRACASLGGTRYQTPVWKPDSAMSMRFNVWVLHELQQVAETLQAEELVGVNGHKFGCNPAHCRRDFVAAKRSSVCLSCMSGERLRTAHTSPGRVVEPVFGDDVDCGVPEVLENTR